MNVRNLADTKPEIEKTNLGLTQNETEHKVEWKKEKTKSTGYWTFFCNPKRWYIDDFLLSGATEDFFAVSEYHKDDFKAGQLGVIRVGHDKRTKQQLAGKERLTRGIYAVVFILGPAELMKGTKKEYWEEEGDADKIRYRVPVRYVKSLLRQPILIDNLNLSAEEYDKYLVEGQQGSSMPLRYLTFKKIMKMIGDLTPQEIHLHGSIENKSDIEKLESKYRHAVPEVKETISKYIERGTISKEFKKKTGFKCQVCEALNEDPYSFKKSNGEYYVETHHVIPVSELQQGSLSTSNLITLCANHHRQIHYGNVELLENTKEKFVYKFDNKVIQIKKIN